MMFEKYKTGGDIVGFIFLGEIMSKRRKNGIVGFIYFIFGLILFILGIFNTDKIAEFNQYSTSSMKEADYVNAYCKGIIEYQLPDRTRVDCLTDEYAIEFDWAKKWAESIGQALYYSKMTGKKPAVAIIIKNSEERIYIERIRKVNPELKIFEIKAENYVE